MKNEIDTDIIPHQTISSIVENVQRAIADAQQGIRLLRDARTRLRQALGHESGGYYADLFKDRLSNYALDDDSDLPEESEKLITRNAWQYIIDQTGLSKFMTDRRRKEIDEQIEKGQLPPLTVENIVGTLQSLSQKVNGLLEESIREVFDWLRPVNDNYGVGRLKTNKRFKVGPKVIVGWAVEYGYGQRYRFQYRSEQRFTSLANAFSLLDGKGVQKYPEDFVTRCKAAMVQNAEAYEDQYFKCKFYGNGNMHIQFKRLDLLDRLNKIGGGEGLPERDVRMKREEMKSAIVPA